jgi:hypothetical protein
VSVRKNEIPEDFSFFSMNCATKIVDQTSIK